MGGGGGAAVDGVNGQGTKEERRGTGGLDILQGERQDLKSNKSPPLHKMFAAPIPFFPTTPCDGVFAFSSSLSRIGDFMAGSRHSEYSGGKYMQCFSPSF